MRAKRGLSESPPPTTGPLGFGHQTLHDLGCRQHFLNYARSLPGSKQSLLRPAWCVANISHLKRSPGRGSPPCTSRSEQWSDRHLSMCRHPDRYRYIRRAMAEAAVKAFWRHPWGFKRHSNRDHGLLLRAPAM
jgi:hypothetical protein